MKIFFSVLSALQACFLLAGNAGGSAAVGLSANPDDQFRFFWLLGRAHCEACRDAGLNL